MPNRFTFFITTLLSLTIVFMPKLFAHAGVDHGDNCVINIGGEQLRLGGFQAIEKIGSGEQLRLGGFQAIEKIGSGKHFCHLFPATGEVIFTFDPQTDMQISNKKLNLQFLALASYRDLLFDFDHAFNKTISQANDSLTIAHNFPEAGLYALQISLQSDELEPSLNNSQRFLFLVGFPIIKILVSVGFGFLLILGFVLLKQLQAGVARKS